MFREWHKMGFGAGYSFKVEKDYCDWELALDGIATISAELKKLARYA